MSISLVAITWNNQVLTNKINKWKFNTSTTHKLNWYGQIMITG